MRPTTRTFRVPPERRRGRPIHRDHRAARHFADAAVRHGLTWENFLLLDALLLYSVRTRPPDQEGILGM
jgi:hypothetical protein